MAWDLKESSDEWGNSMKIIVTAFVLSTFLTVSFARAERVKENDTFPAFKLAGVRDNKDKALDLEVLQRENKVVIVDFWASWCGPCKESFPILDKIAKKYKNKGVAVVGINVDNEKLAAVDFAKKVPVSFSLVWDEGQKISSKAGVPAMPSSYIMDQTGKVRFVHKGFFPGDSKKFESEIETILKSAK
jgi:thiol-disulfide isomerase/thioredoxin